MTDSLHEHRNEVVLVGRVTSPAAERILPSGDPISSWRITVERGGDTGYDVVDCTAWTARNRRSAATWVKGDIVEITGALRRRFYRAGGSVASACDVEVYTARRVSRGVTPSGRAGAGVTRRRKPG
jgi:single-strand DNA-binding protein